jgi:uncharacterized protein (TIGR03083 family)
VTTADSTISALRSGHEGLAGVVRTLGDQDLAAPSGSTEWDVSQVLSHLGSGAEIGRATLQAALDGKPNPGHDFNLAVWDRWNALSGRERADGFLASNEVLTRLFESLDADTRQNLRIDMGFMPAPVEVAFAARLRLNELAMHAWDVRVAFDPHAALAPEATAELLRGEPPLLGWISKPDRLNGERSVIRVTTSDPGAAFTLRLDDPISLDDAAEASADGTLTIPAEAWLRLVAGRLSPEHTPEGIEGTGSANVDLLRRVFPGF